MKLAPRNFCGGVTCVAGSRRSTAQPFPRKVLAAWRMGKFGPQLSSFPERVYTWIADAQITLPEVLHIPLRLNDQESLGTLWVVADTPGHFDSDHARAASELASFVGIALRMAKTEQQLKDALDEQELLAGEMSHRVKNVLTIIDGLIRASARSASSTGEMARVLSGRVQALAAAQALALKSAKDPHQAGQSDLQELLEAVFRPYAGNTAADTSRFCLSGPALSCGEHAANNTALIFHELTTNAAKYGALSTASGRIAVIWAIEDSRLQLTWEETGGPPLFTAPVRQGFGNKLIQETVLRRFGGMIELAWRPEGLRVALELPLEGLMR
jgi:two-component sensor histidine kinase